MVFALRVLCDVSLWFCTPGFVASCFGMSAPLIAPALIMALACLASSALRGRGSARLYPLALLSACFFWADGIPQLVSILPPCVYCIFMCAGRRFDQDYDDFRMRFRYCPLLLLPGLLAALFAGVPAVERFMFPFFLIHIFSGILLLRTLRHGESMRHNKSLLLTNAALALVFGAGTWLLSSSMVLSPLGAALSAIYDTIIAPVLSLLVYAVAGAGWLAWRGISLLTLNDPTDTEPVELDTGMGLDLTAGEAQTLAASWIPAALGGILAGLLALLVVYFFKRLYGARLSNRRTVTFSSEHLQAGKRAEKPERMPLVAPREPRQAVRWYYRKFLISASARGIPIRPCDTSQSVADSCESLFCREKLDDLRGLYIRARYSPAPVTRDDARAAAAAFRELRAQE